MEIKRLARLTKRVFFFFLPVLIVILSASTLAFFATFSATQVEAAVFVAEEETGAAGQATASLGNVLLFLVPAIAGSFGILYIIKRGKKRTLKRMFRGMLTFATGVILAFFLYKLNEILYERIWFALWVKEPVEFTLYTIPELYSTGSFLGFIMAGMIVGYIVTSSILSRGFTRKERNGSLIVISSLMGAFMAVILPTWTVLPLLIGLALWDIYAVFKGPIKEMVELDMNGKLMARWDPLGDDSDEFPFDNLTYDAGSWQLGIGDLVFYSVLAAHSLYYATAYVRTEGWWMLPFFFVPVVIAILIGFAYTIYRLTRDDSTGILPGLPIPMFLGVGTFILMMIIASLIL
ncbi:MAG: hypothetical protein U9R75_11620 [Candidatus Thermoplasmatota archaeon]|nr:hypothetical protein [Candidatus Thermoplasmatota archaeon]